VNAVLAAPTPATTPGRPRAHPAHDEKVRAIAARVRDLIGRGEPVHIDKGGVHHVVPLPGDPRFKSRPIDVSNLRDILEIDVAGRRCVAEPGVTFAELARATLAHGLVPVVVPELEGITLGGAVAGCSVESMSFRHGGFHDGCLEYEVVTGAGEVLVCSRETEPLAFGMIHGSYGTLGILTRLTFQLVPAKPYVRMEYVRHRTAAAFQADMHAHMKKGTGGCGAEPRNSDVDFIDGIVHGPDEYVLCLGRFAEKAPYVSSYRWLNIFHKSTRTRTEDFLTTADYFFRYDTECHWLTGTLPPLEWKAVRFAVGKLVLGSTNLIKWSKRLAPLLGLKKRPDVVVDLFIPSRRCQEFFDWYEKSFNYWPLWVVPYRIAESYPWVSASHSARQQDDLFLDVAIYGKRNDAPDVDWSQVLEEKAFELDGIKTLISRNHYTRERFWEIYHRDNYAAAKARLDPKGVFPDLYDKFHRV
jgi:FAD/FMN-containing dehydrogenase